MISTSRLQKSIHMTERANLILRAESYNTTNHLNLYTLNGVYGNGANPVATFGHADGWTCQRRSAAHDAVHGAYRVLTSIRREDVRLNPQLRGLAPLGCILSKEVVEESMHIQADREKRSHIFHPIFTLLVAITLLSFQVDSPAQAAAHYAIISGTVTDQTGGAVPGAHVIVRSADFSSTRTLVTDVTPAALPRPC